MTSKNGTGAGMQIRVSPHYLVAGAATSRAPLQVFRQKRGAGAASGLEERGDSRPEGNRRNAYMCLRVCAFSFARRDYLTVNYYLRPQVFRHDPTLHETTEPRMGGHHFPAGML